MGNPEPQQKQTQETQALSTTKDINKPDNWRARVGLGPPEEKSPGGLSVWHDLYVDLLGSLVPGLLTVILGGTAVALALSSVYTSLFYQTLGTEDILVKAKDVIASVHWEIATVIVVSAYVIGAVFFRQDPKKPDAASALNVWMNATPGDRNGLAVQAEKKPPSDFFSDPDCTKPTLKHRLRAILRPKLYAGILGLDAQFPYLHLRCYLASRGLTHLVHLVPWCPQNQDTHGFRSKMFINILKVRLLALYPRMSRDIIRNEAHVRLATSVWYAVTTLLILSILVLLTTGIAGARLLGSPMNASLFFPSSFAALLLVFCAMMRLHLRKCIHYMRVREVIYVLETAHLAESLAGELLFQDLSTKLTKHGCSNCTRTKASVAGNQLNPIETATATSSSLARQQPVN
jgi:hypothetical protein